MNTFGEKLRLTTFGESHGEAIGGVVDGFPSNITVDFDFVGKRMAERRPGRPGTSPRNEKDIPEFLSGISPDGVTLGTPIGFVIRNSDVRSSDYGILTSAFRPGHADYTYFAKYGIRDHRGGGRASARETACRVVAGALAEQLLAIHDISVEASLISVGGIAGDLDTLMQEVERAARDHDSVGGVVECTINGLPAGLGEPVYDKFSARLAYAMMSINAAKGFEIGDGFALAAMRGSQSLDDFIKSGESLLTESNHSGGVLGGITNGMPVICRVAFKPTPTLPREVPLADKEGNVVNAMVTGRHDPCVAVRAVPVVRAMAALVAADFLLQK